jgi:hypothetical protein
MEQLPLGAPYSDDDTSREAAESIVPHLSKLRAKVLAAVVASRFEGRTCDEVEAETGMRHQTASARMYELRNMGMIVAAETPLGARVKRLTRSKRLAVVYVGPDFKRPTLLEQEDRKS